MPVSRFSDAIVAAVVPALSTSTLTVAALATLALVGSAFAGRSRVAVRHVVLVAALAASVVATVASLSRASVTIEVPWWRQAAVAPTADVAAVRRVVPSGEVPMSGDAERAVAWLWLAGVACVALRALRQTRAAQALCRRAVAVTDPAWTQAIAVARRTTGFDQPLRVLVSAEIDIPFVTGLWRPAVLIPSAGGEWSAEEKRSVLAHEIAHLTRFDLWTRALATVACALHWFNPIVWWLASRAERDAELAADDLALRSGILPSVYADALLSVAEGIAWHRPSPIVLAFARRSSLEPRIVAVLAPARGTLLVGSRTRAAVIVASCAITAAVGCVRLAPRTEVESRSRLTAVPSPAEITPGHPLRAPVAQDSAARPKRAATPRPRASSQPRPAGPRVNADWMDDAVQGLIDTLDDPSPQVRVAAASSLLRLGSGESSGAVDRALNKSSVSRETLERIRTEKR